MCTYVYEVKVVELTVTFVYGYNISRESRDNPGKELFHVNFTHVQTNNASYSFICLYLCPEQTGYKSEEVIISGTCGKSILLIVYIYNTLVTI